MFLGPHLRDVLSQLLKATSFDTLCEGLAHAAREMGFDHVALVQHGSLPRLAEHALVVTNYPTEFIKSYIENHHYVLDPVYEVSELLDRPFTWDEIPGLVPLREPQLALFGAARLHGISHGVTIPLHIPGEPRASCTFAASRVVEATPDLLAALHVIASYGFNMALRLYQPKRRVAGPKLTRREAECTTLVALGKTDWEIGKILGLGGATVKYFISVAMQRYGVYKRSALVARALLDGQILNEVNDGE
ncbi:LuxR family transcriptional regulator [Sphingobium sp. CFD-2]|uniref:LuxR family transcriptional regulator n=1 Tax=Sphingobium sp. CFD-2 TaxID=2878542 RepID=UPI00214CB019|nr:LuxR family transcriptional regulator [Sphingobium sp. CFD-2]TNE30048.1 MAG: LuxR family transcriptional regulator [Alphaproteobacteria bacterium]TNF05239.1 MAG: LuxR family transcriptional regulator [Sphingomonadales bacterium]